MSDEGYKTSPVVGYIRSAQINDPRLDEWEAEIRAYASERGYYLVKVARESGTSGVASYRPVLNEILNDLTSGEYIGLIVLNRQHLSSNRTTQERLRGKIDYIGAWIEYIYS
jgi:DNA invertase Pin-like site-specific DNA recombinase